MEFILHIINPCAGSWSLYSTLIIPVQGREVYTPHYYSLCGIVEFMLHIINPCAGSWSLCSTLLILVLGHGAYTPYYYSLCRLVGVVEFAPWESFSDLSNELRSDALPVTIIVSQCVQPEYSNHCYCRELMG